MSWLVRIYFGFLLFLCIPRIAWTQSAVIKIGLDNDILNLPNQTDRYYTNGLDIAFYHSNLSGSFLDYLLIGGRKTEKQLTGILFEQKIYTPKDIYTSELQTNDRPYASTALLSAKKIVVNRSKNYRMSSSFGLGIIGKYAGGELFQNFIHGLTVNSENANGWSHQIKNDLLTDYKFDFEKGLLNSPFFQLGILSNSQIGSLQTRFSGGLNIAIGMVDGYYENVFKQSGNSDYSCFFYANGGLGYVFYDATLEGGLFNSSNNFVMSNELILRSQYTYSLGIQMNSKSLNLQLGRAWQSQEFVNSENHAWGFIKVSWFLK